MSKLRFRFKDNDFYIHHLLSDLPISQDVKTYKSLQQMHAHENYELFLLIKGDCSFLIEGTEYPLRPGCIVIMRPAEVHCLKFNSDTGCERIALNFEQKLIKEVDPKGVLLESYIERPLGTYNMYSPTEFTCNASTYITNMVETDINLNLYERRLHILANLLPLLDEIHQIYRKKIDKSFGEEGYVFSDLLSYINNNIRNDLSLELLSDLFYLSKSQLNRNFHKLTGTTIWRYITEKRLILAREMILSGNSAYKTCFDCGFKDYSAFFRAYKNKFRTSPTSRGARSDK